MMERKWDLKENWDLDKEIWELAYFIFNIAVGIFLFAGVLNEVGGGFNFWLLGTKEKGFKAGFVIYYYLI